MTKTSESPREMPRRPAAAGPAVVVLAVLALAGCREGEQNRLLTYEPGVYQGRPDPGADQIDDGALRHRARQIQDYN